MKELSLIDGITVFDNPSSDFNSNHWLTCILIDSEVTGFKNKDLFRKGLCLPSGASLSDWDLRRVVGVFVIKN
jgi:hypothetical protein